MSIDCLACGCTLLQVGSEASIGRLLLREKMMIEVRKGERLQLCAECISYHDGKQGTTITTIRQLLTELRNLDTTKIPHNARRIHNIQELIGLAIISHKILNFKTHQL